jgi:hypothetical protein
LAFRPLGVRQNDDPRHRGVRLGVCVYKWITSMFLHFLAR